MPRTTFSTPSGVPPTPVRKDLDDETAADERAENAPPTPAPKTHHSRLLHRFGMYHGALVVDAHEAFYAAIAAAFDAYTSTPDNPRGWFTQPARYCGCKRSPKPFARGAVRDAYVGDETTPLADWIGSLAGQITECYHSTTYDGEDSDPVIGSAALAMACVYLRHMVQECELRITRGNARCLLVAACILAAKYLYDYRAGCEAYTLHKFRGLDSVVVTRLSSAMYSALDKNMTTTIQEYDEAFDAFAGRKSILVKGENVPHGFTSMYVPPVLVQLMERAGG